jgi:hypothetical protein
MCDDGAAKIPMPSPMNVALAQNTTCVGSVNSSWVTKIPQTLVSRKLKKSALFQNQMRDSSFGFPFHLQLLKDEKQM